MDDTALKAQRAIAALFETPYELITVAEMLTLQDELTGWANSQCNHNFFKCQVPAGDSCQPIYHQVCRLCRWDATKGVYIPSDIWQKWAAREAIEAMEENAT